MALAPACSGQAPPSTDTELSSSAAGGSAGTGASAGSAAGGGASGGSVSGGSGGELGGAAGAATRGTAGGPGGSSGSGGAGAGGSGQCSGDADCDDGVFCNGPEACVLGGCVAGTAPCDDGVGCTTDSCDEATQSCSSAADDAVCDNAIACDGVESCHPMFGCQSSGGSCDDAIACTVDYCDAATGECAHQPDDGACSDGVFCNGPEQCDPPIGDPVTGCAAGAPVICQDGIPCTVDLCDEAAKLCAHVVNDAACSDGLFCNGAEVCAPGTGCQSGLPPSCGDNRDCTLDACDEAQKTCTHTTNDLACSDGLFCNGAEACSLAGPVPSGCVPGIAPSCLSDGIACTLDACDEATNLCAHMPVHAACGPGQFCVPPTGGCSLAPPCQSDAECDDGDACNGVEHCSSVCQPGVPISCDDLVDCTVDSCDPTSGACAHVPEPLYCDDSLACNGIETCDAVMGCLDGAAVACDDGVDCTFDGCSEPDGTCLFTPMDWACSDGLVCNGDEACTPNGCVAGAPHVCPSDGVACTTEICDAQANGCISLEDDGMCPCGQTCSAAQGGCGNFCVVATCQGKVYQCGDCVDNDGDCAIDSSDTECLGPCDNTEDGFYGGIPGQNNSPCKSDCYFDQDTGSGNDDCFWSHKCDPFEVAPDYAPEGSQCAFNPNANIPGYAGGCAQAFADQSATCDAYCGPLTPNGCDCFGCCAIPGAPTPVWLGSENPAGTGSCDLQNIANPAMCKPCTQVESCLNACDHCEVCVGKPDLPPDCSSGQECPDGAPPCGLPGQAPCTAGFTCITGCCQANPL